MELLFLLECPAVDPTCEETDTCDIECADGTTVPAGTECPVPETPGTGGGSEGGCCTIGAANTPSDLIPVFGIMLIGALARRKRRDSRFVA